MAKIKFKISKEGTVSEEVTGAEGMKCEEITLAFERALGSVEDCQRKPNYYIELEYTEIHEED